MTYLLPFPNVEIFHVHANFNPSSPQHAHFPNITQPNTLNSIPVLEVRQTGVRGTILATCSQAGPALHHAAPCTTLAVAHAGTGCHVSTMAPPPRCLQGPRVVGRSTSACPSSRVAHALAAHHAMGLGMAMAYTPIPTGHPTALGERVFSNIHWTTLDACL